MTKYTNSKGEELEIATMNTAYINNCIKKLLRQLPDADEMTSKVIQDELKGLRIELSKRVRVSEVVR